MFLRCAAVDRDATHGDPGVAPELAPLNRSSRLPLARLQCTKPGLTRWELESASYRTTPLTMCRFHVSCRANGRDDLSCNATPQTHAGQAPLSDSPASASLPPDIKNSDPRGTTSTHDGHAAVSRHPSNLASTPVARREHTRRVVKRRGRTRRVASASYVSPPTTQRSDAGVLRGTTPCSRLQTGRRSPLPVTGPCMVVSRRA